MTQARDDAVRPFRVNARHGDHHHARLLDEVSFEAAAVAYLETLHAIPPGDPMGGDTIRIVVRDVGTGREHCFVIDLESGETAPCG